MGNVTAESPGFVEDVDMTPEMIAADKTQKKKGIIPTSQEPQAKADFSHTNNPKTHKPFTFDDYNTDANLVGMVLEHGGNKPEDKEQILEDIWQDVVKNGEGQQDLDFNTFKTTLKEASVGKWNAAFKGAETLSVKQTAPEPPAQAEKAQEKEEKGPTVNKPVGRVPVNKTPAEKKTVEPIVKPEDPNIAKLKDLGYTQELINKIQPQYIQNIINNKIPPPGGEKKVAQKKEEDKPITEVQKEPTVEPAKTKGGRTVTANKPFETPKAKTQREVTEQAQRGRDEFDIPAYKADDIDFMKKGRDTDMDRALYKAMDSVNKAINTIRKEGPWVQEIPEGRVAGEEDEEMKWLPAALQGGGLKSLIGHPKAGSTISEAANKVGARFLQGLQEEGKGESLINYSPKQLGLAILEALDGMINEGDDGKSGKSWSDNLAKLISSQGKIPNQQMRKAVAEPIADQEKRIKKVAEHYNSETEGGDIDNANDGSHMDVGSVAKKSKKLVTY